MKNKILLLIIGLIILGIGFTIANIDEISQLEQELSQSFNYLISHSKYLNTLNEVNIYLNWGNAW